MKKLASLFVALFSLVWLTGAGWLPLARSGGYTGPGDIVGSWQVWYGLRAFSAAKRGTKAINVCNVSDVACADFLTDATTGALVVTTVGGSDCSVVVCTIKTLYDQSGALACTGACDNTQATISARPTLKTTCPGLTIPCAQFTTAPQEFNAATLAASTSQPFSMSMVYNRFSGTTYGGGLSFTSPDARFAAEGAPNQIQVYTGTVLDATAADATFIAANAIFSNANCVVMVNGTDTGPASCGTNGAGSTIQINFPTGQPINQYFGEAGMTSVGFTSGNRTSLNSNQRAFWGF